MTIAEFDEEINDWRELKDFCSNFGCSICDDVYSADEVNNYINDRLYDMARSEDWTDVRGWLLSFEESYDAGYYRIDEYEEISYLDYDYDYVEYKSDVRDWAIENEVLDSDEESDESDEEYGTDADEEYVPEERPFEIEDFSFDELYEQSSIILNTIQKERHDDCGGVTYSVLSDNLWS